MRVRQTIGAALFATALGLSLWGCPKDKTTETSTQTSSSGATTSAATAGKKLRIAVIPKGTQNSYWVALKQGAEAAAAEDQNIEIIWQGPEPEDDATNQVDVFKTQVNNKVDGIVLAVIDKDSMVNPVKEAMAKGIKVVTVDSGLAKDKDTSVCYIATDNVAGGAKAADTLAKAIGEKGNVGLLYFQKGSGSSDEREKGFEDEIKKYPNIHLVQSRAARDPNKAADETTNMLTAHSDIVGIFAANEPNGDGAANVLKQRKLGGKIKVVAFDTSDSEIQALKDGTILALIVQSPYQMGLQGVKAAVKAIKGEDVGPKSVDSGLTVVTKDNLETPEVKKLLNPGK
jgi:ribose transport system substrate-binding protein